MAKASASLFRSTKIQTMNPNFNALVMLFGVIIVTTAPAMAFTPANPTGTASKIKKDRTYGKVICRVADRELQGEFVGNCDEDGNATGYATISGKASYTGQFVKGQKTGFGIKTWPNGDTYAGQFINDYKEGQGIYRWGKNSPTPDDVYIGEFRHDQRWGLGTYHWSNGDQYSGQWEADKYVGYATPMQTLQHKHLQSLATAVKKAGVTVCRNVEPPGPTNQVLIGKVQSVNGDILHISLMDKAVDAQGKPIKMINDSYLNWVPCDPESIATLQKR